MATTWDRLWAPRSAGRRPHQSHDTRRCAAASAAAKQPGITVRGRGCKRKSRLGGDMRSCAAASAAAKQPDRASPRPATKARVGRMHGACCTFRLHIAPLIVCVKLPSVIATALRASVSGAARSHVRRDRRGEVWIGRAAGVGEALLDAVVRRRRAPCRARRRCGRGEPSPGADVGGVSPVPAQMWAGELRTPCRYGNGGTSSGDPRPCAVDAWGEPSA
jgi:hypothetical protein